MSIDEKILAELVSQKKLKILELIAFGYTQGQIAATLGVSDATLSNMLPKGISKKAPDLSKILSAHEGA